MLKEKYQKIIVSCSVLFFLIWKFSTLTFRFGDSNAYFFMADQLFKGLIPYRDYFLADPPLMIILLGLIKIIIGKNIILLQSFPFIAEALTSYLLFLILKKEKIALAFLAPTLYLFSFSILSTSDFVTGVQLVSLFSTSALYAYQKQAFKFSGFFWGLACLVKLYSVFLLLGFFLAIFLIEKKPRNLISIIWGGIISFLIFLLPFFILSFKETFASIIIHHLHRPAGNSKLVTFSFFFQKEWLLIILAFLGGLKLKKWLYLLPVSVFIIFLIIFQDLYYTYFGALIPFLVLLMLPFFDFLFYDQKFNGFFPIFSFVYLVFILIGTNAYQKNHLPFGIFTNSQEIAQYFQNQSDNKPLYGSHEVAPLIALLADRQLFENHIDTNPQAFGSGAQDQKKISQKLIAENAYLIARIGRRPEYGPVDIGTEGYFDQELFRQKCHETKSFTSSSKEWDNLIVIYQCSN